MRSSRLWPLVWLCPLICASLVSQQSHAATLEVGAGKTYSKVSAAIAAAKAGDTILVSPGTYTNDVAQITKDLTIRGVLGQARPHLKATTQIGNGKGIFVIGGKAKVVVEHLEFSGAKVKDNNGAGIRMQGVSLEVRDCYVHGNQNGILAGGTNTYTVLIERSEFADNGNQGSGYEHNIYISGDCTNFTLRESYSHGAKSGHNVKSRAKLNYILYNRIMDESTGTASYTIDLPQGGRSYVIGNLLQQGPKAENTGTMISYKSEGATNPILELFVINNTFVNEVGKSTHFVRAKQATKVWMLNNLLVGQGKALDASAVPAPAKKEQNNLVASDNVLVDRAGYDYRLVAGSAPIDAGVAPGTVNGFDLTPKRHYTHPLSATARPTVGAIDVGAYEWGSGPPPADGGVTHDSGERDASPAADGGSQDSGAIENDGSTTRDGLPPKDLGNDGASAGGVDDGCRVAQPSNATLWALLVLFALVELRRWRR